MSYTKRGINISKVEVLNISKNGIWIFVQEKEYFLPYDNYPWFKNSRIDEIFDVELLHERHLFWKKLDIDLEIKSLEYPEKYPLTYK